MHGEILRAWWFHKQGLDQRSKLSADQILERTGWARSVGGVNPYLTIFSRTGLSREEMDKALAKQEIHELPSARGCTYVVPKAHYSLALRVGQPIGDPQDLVTAKKLGVTEKEIQSLEDKIVKALTKDILDPRELKDKLGAAVRSLGEEGKKRGITTTLPIALGRLQNDGRIRRISTDGRLDNQRYKYAAWLPSPLNGDNRSREKVFEELARIYFKWIGPASLANFQWFSGLGVAATKNAVAPLKLQSVDNENALLLLPEELDAFKSFKCPKSEQIALVGCIDGLVHLRRDVSMHLDENKIAAKLMSDKKPNAGLLDLPNNGIFDRGRLVGLWEYDPDKEQIAWKTFEKPTAATKKAVAETESFVRDQLGDARSFSLDSPQSRKPKIDVLRKA